MKIRLLVLFLMAIGLTMCSQPDAYVYNEGYIYGTIYHIVYESPEGADLHDEIKAKLDEYNSIFSTYDPNSVISKINNNVPVEPDEIFMKCFRRSMEISEITDGAFDITAGPMVNAWGFGPEERRRMNDEIIDSLKAITGFRKISMDGTLIIKESPQMKLDMSAVAKGFTCDLIGGFLSENGCRNYMVEIGGEVVAKGINEHGRVWTIGINRPDEKAFFANSDIQAKVKIPAHALATSGNYRNYYEEDGKKFAHTINPKTGFPVQHSLLSTTVISGNCMDSDAFATAFMVLGLDKSIEIAEKIPELKVYFIYSDENGENRIYMSENFKEHLSE